MNKSDKNRAEQYKKDNIQENVLKVMNKALSEKEIELINGFKEPQLPIIFIVGAQRSGTTLLMQLLIQHFELSYPNNFISRYWDAPYMGAMLYKNLSKNLNNTLLDLSSDLGYTKGLGGPHEFGYFWKKWFPWESWEDKKYDTVNYDILQKQLAAWESVNHTSLIFKNLIQVDYNISKLDKIIPNSYFIFIKRDLAYNIQSTLQSRIKLSGNEKEWFGVKPKNYKLYQELPVIKQIASQIIDTNDDIKEQLDNIAKDRVIELTYEDLVNDYKNELNKISLKIKLKQRQELGEAKIVSGNNIKLDKTTFNKIKTVVSIIESKK